MKRIKRLFFLVLLLTIFMGSFFVIAFLADNSIGKATETGTVVINKGDDFIDVAERLKEKKLISKKLYFIYFVWVKDLSRKLVAGEYIIQPNMKIPEIVEIMIKGETKPTFVKLTFPEGWTAKEMADRLNANNLPGDDFLKIANSKNEALIGQFSFLAGIPEETTLEGFLFPDTYFFDPASSAETIINRMLKNFDTRLTGEMREKIAAQEKEIYEIITMASIVESEVKTDKDRKLVSGIFWNRLGIGMALQSDATVSYVLGGEKKIQHNAKDISIDSPYNTYRFKGLPPGPISNPGISSIVATLEPAESNYLYFLNNPKTGETFFSATFEEHVSKKSINGL